MDKGYMFLVFIFLPFLALTLTVEEDTEDTTPIKPFDINNPCQCVFENNSIIDFSQDGFSDGTARFPHQPFNDSGPEDGPKFSFNPCFPFSDDAEGKDNVYLNLEPRCKDTMGCFYKKLEDPVLNVHVRTGFGKLENANFFWDPESEQIGIKYFTSALDGKKTNNLTVLFNCVEDEETKPKIYATIGEASVITVEYWSRCACINGCAARVKPSTSTSGGGLSVGSILVILFFTFLVIYILGGITINVVLRGASGKEVLPHYEFWSNLPGLIGDGVCFVCSCCCTKTPNRSTYDNM